MFSPPLSLRDPASGFYVTSSGACLRSEFKRLARFIMEIFPTALNLTDTALEVTWSDESVQAINIQVLRDHCPCATCREKRSGGESKAADPLAVISTAEAAPTRIQGMRPVGSYGYSIQFSDGHSTGIFTFDFLRSLSTQ